MEYFFNRKIFKIIFTRKEVVPVHVYPQRQFQLFFCRESNRCVVKKVYGDEAGSAFGSV